MAENTKSTVIGFDGMEVNIAGVKFKNPVTVASGTFGSGAEYCDFVDLNKLGAVTTKGVANIPWAGNPTPRIAETYGGMMNAVGLQNPGIDVFCERDIPFLKQYDTNIIVNEDGNGTTEQNKHDTDTSKKKDITDELTKQIKESNDSIVKVSGISKISSSALKELYGTDKTLTVMFDDYDLSIRGQDIFNANNEINTKLDLSETSDGLLINMTDENKLPGTITVSLKNDPNTYKYFYLMNNSKDYQMLNTLSNNTIKISSIGKYLLTEKNMNKIKINVVWVLGAAGFILLMSLIYIFTKKKYWFW